MGLKLLFDLRLSMKTSLYIMESGMRIIIKGMEEVYNIGWMGVDMKDIGKTIRRI
jgi:hypothetical protein